jgi:hypothetical protein
MRILRPIVPGFSMVKLSCVLGFETEVDPIEFDSESAVLVLVGCSQPQYPVALFLCVVCSLLSRPKDLGEEQARVVC